MPAEETPLKVHRFAHNAMNCDWEIFVTGHDEEYARQATAAAFEEVDFIENQLSRFYTDSDVARLNNAAPGETIRVGPATRACLLLAGEIGEQTDGAFDIMVGRAMDEIRSGGKSHVELLPNEPLLEINPENGAVTVLGEGVAIDFGALGKGYAVDEIVRVLRDWSIGAALIHGGTSSVYALGAPPGQAGWPVELRHFREGESPFGGLVLRDAALGASGDAARHIVDPRSGRSASGAVNAWVANPSAARADALSTSLMVVSPNEAPNIAAHCLGALILRNGENGLTAQRWGIFEPVELNLESGVILKEPPATEESPIVRGDSSGRLGSPQNDLTSPPLNHPVTVQTVCGGLEKTETGELIGIGDTWLSLRSENGSMQWIPLVAVRAVSEADTPVGEKN